MAKCGTPKLGDPSAQNLYNTAMSLKAIAHKQKDHVVR